MNFVRAVFIFALVMLAVGMLGSRLWLQNAFRPSAEPLATLAVASQSKPSVTAVTTPTSSRRGRTSGAPHAISLSTVPTRSITTPVTKPAAGAGGAIHVVHHHRVHRARPTPTPLPTPVPTPGTVTLANYWVNQTVVRHGRTFALGYVINNGTGHTLHLMLGASLKSSHTLSWAVKALSDPGHDVVAIVPPGVSTHERFFTLPSRVRPGAYDVAWGLRNAVTGDRAGLVAAPGALKVLG